MCATRLDGVLTRESGDVHDGDVPRLEDDHGESPGGRLVTQRQQQLAPAPPRAALLLHHTSLLVSALELLKVKGVNEISPHFPTCIH